MQTDADGEIIEWWRSACGGCGAVPTADARAAHPSRGSGTRLCASCTEQRLSFWDEFAVLGDGRPSPVGIGQS